MAQHEADWSYDRNGEDADVEYDKYDKIVGDLSRRCLEQLSLDIGLLETDKDGWSIADSEALGLISEIDQLESLLVPPTTTPLENRQAFKSGITNFRAALPFRDAERQWLLANPDQPLGAVPANEAYLDFIRQSEGEVMSAGISRAVGGRDLLQRWWSWRREVGEYAGQGSLDQARFALEGVIELLAPELGLPEAYVELRASENRSPQPPIA